MTDAQNTSQVLPSAPPPPSEVKVRTLRPDLASIAQSGGGLPKYQNVRIDGTQVGGQKKNINGILTVVAAIVLFGIIVAIAAYFVNQLVLKK